MTGMICNDNSLELIKKYKNKLIESTNVEISKDEMVGIDFILFRFWKKGLLDKLEDFDRQKAEIEKYKNIKTTMDEFWDILLRCKVANRKEKPTIEELADSIHQIEVNAIKEFASRIEGVLSLHPAQAKYYYEIKKEYIKENENDKRKI